LFFCSSLVHNLKELLKSTRVEHLKRLVLGVSLSVAFFNVMPSVVMLSVIMVSVIMLSVILLYFIMLSVVMLYADMLSVIMLSVVVMNAVMLSVSAPLH
jgi:hypothetical protein